MKQVVNYKSVLLKTIRKILIENGTNSDGLTVSKQPVVQIDSKNFDTYSEDSFTFMQPTDRVHKKITSSNLSIQVITSNELKFMNKILGKGGQGTVFKIACALSYLHLQPVPIIHRNIKPNNVLVNENLLVKICDLGLANSKAIDESLQSTRNSIQGTYLFMEPEILMGREKATTQSDVWSFACTITSLYIESPIWDMDGLFG
ncbi:hypothetical protein TSAR_013811 [Trichomalopsis sarcophagae]|uniref:Protein kinase domain-containing protein n=1 Tax=Trichomalopsis sarcophagae TaxID=543379 RepID=A0A232ET48_9HYME|nr:hypothetical protein TSAR_013811 [Trichomalopsis sarcophagae]